MRFMRKKSGLITSVIGVFLNILLATAKLIVGFLSGSIAIITDSINNFSDSVSSLAALFSFVLSEKKPDKVHPFGHGRLEYVIAMGIAMLIGVVGVEFLISSIKGIVNPGSVVFSWVAFAVVSASIAVKLGMGIMYSIMGKKLNSAVLKAAKADSFQDVCISSLTLVAFSTQQLTSFPIDGVCGLVLAVIIIFSAIKLIKDTVNPILGEKQELLTTEINSLLLTDGRILGSHDLMIHSYGVSSKVASVHAELSDKLSLNEAHDIIDKIEKTARETLNCDLVIHVDPECEGDVETENLRSIVRTEIKAIYPSLSIHDFRYNKENLTISFDLSLPYALCKKQTEIENKVVAIKNKLGRNYIINFRVDNR